MRRKAIVPVLAFAAAVALCSFTPGAGTPAADFVGATGGRPSKVTKEDLSRFVEDAMTFVHHQRITDGRAMKGREFDGLYQSFKEDPRNPDSRYIAKYGRVWIYDQALAIFAELKYGHEDHAREAVDALVRLAEWEASKGFRGLWHFSYNTRDDDFIDPRGPLGANLWALNAILAYINQTGDTKHLAWANRVLQTYVFSQQVDNPADPRHGLFLAGLENPVDLARGDAMGYHVYEGIPSDFEEVLHKNQRLSQVILGYVIVLPHPLNQPVAAIDGLLLRLRPVDEIINSQVQFCSIEHAADAIGTLRLADRVNRRFKGSEKMLDEIRRRHALVAAALNKLWIPADGGHFVTGMNADGTLNRSVAVDNNQWVGNVVLALDEERAWRCIRFTKEHFWTEDEGFVGLFFFDKDFTDRYVDIPPEDRAKLPRMIQPEATWGYIHFLMQFAAQTANPERKAEAQAMLDELTASMIGFQKYFAANKGRFARGFAQWSEVVGRISGDLIIGALNEPIGALVDISEELRGTTGYFFKYGAPYASIPVHNLFTTLEGLASTATSAIVGLELLGRSSDDFIGVKPSPELLR